MPPKKSKAAAGDSNDGDKGAFKWTPELDLKLLYLMTLPRSIGAKEHAEIATALGVPTPGGVRNRAWKLKSDHRKAYEDCGLAMPGGGAVSKVAGKADDGSPAKPKTNPAAPRKGGRKRAIKDVSGEEDDKDLGSNGGKKMKTGESEEGDFELDGGFDGVKAEPDDEV